MKIALIGKGKTGAEALSLLKAEEVSGVYDSINQAKVNDLEDSDVVIVFVPTDAMESVLPTLIDSKKPVVCGTTGCQWTEDLDKQLKAQGTPWIVANNFSIGMNLMFFLTQELGMLSSKLPGSFDIHEVHHIHKKDKPSGSAIQLLKCLNNDTAKITSERKDDVKGIHSLNLKLPNEQLSITHEALDRKIFAQGAILAAKSLINKTNPGINSFETLIQKEWKQLIKENL